MNEQKLPKAKGLRVRGSGPNYGLSLLLYIERNEYIEGLFSGAGGKVIVHEYGTLANVDNDGLSISPGKEINIGLKKIFVERLNYRKHTCIDTTDYLKKGYNYTQNTCNSLCEDQLIYKYCGCFRPEYYEHYNIRQLESYICESVNREKDKNCTQRVLTLIRNSLLNCSCDKSCYTTDFNIEMSENDYPADSKWYSLVNSVCEQDKHDCYYLQQFKSPEERRRVLRENFIRLRIYYRDLNFQHVKESLSYSLAQFLSDFGGSIGLWIGMSLITIIEIGDFLLGLCQWLYFNKCKG